MNDTKYIGMDVHRESISIAVMNSAGKIVLAMDGAAAVTLVDADRRVVAGEPVAGVRAGPRGCRGAHLRGVVAPAAEDAAVGEGSCRRDGSPDGGQPAAGHRRVEVGGGEQALGVRMARCLQHRARRTDLDQAVDDLHQVERGGRKLR